MTNRTNDEAPSNLRTQAGVLWFPLLFLCGFLLCYLLPFHAPTPHHVRIAISDRGSAAVLARNLEHSAPGAFDVIPVASRDAARRAVLGRSAVAAVSVQDKADTLYVAEANGSLLQETVTSAFSAVATSQHRALRTVDLVTTARGDELGSGLFYLALIWNLIPYVTVMTQLRAVTLTRRTKLLTLAAVGAVISVVAYLFARSLDVIPNQPLALFYGFLMTQTIGWVTFGLAPYVKQFIPGVAVALFVMLSIPSSGGAVPYEMVPAFFRFLHPIMPLGNLMDALKGVLYFNDRGLLRPTLVLCGWLGSGMALIGLNAVGQRRRGQQPSLGIITAGAAGGDPSIEAPMPRAVLPGNPGRLGQESAMISGTIRHDDGTPATDVFVTVLAPGGQQILRIRTDDQGRYAVTGLSQEYVAVVVLAEGYVASAARVLTHEGRPIRQDFQLNGLPAPA